MNKIYKSFSAWTSLNEDTLNEAALVNTPANKTVSFSPGYMNLTNNKMVNHIEGFEKQIKDYRTENTETWAIVGFNEISMNDKPYVLSSSFTGVGSVAAEGRELLFISSDKKEVQKKFKSGDGNLYASIAWGKVEYATYTDSAINITPIDILIKKI